MLNRCLLPSTSRSSAQGFTLIELMVASVMSILIVGSAFLGLMVLIQNRSKTSINTAQEENLNLALDLIGDDIRAARRINSTGGAAIAVIAVVAAANSATAFNPPLNSTAGTYVLYLEIPLQGPSTCPPGTDLDGLTPPSIDRVLYDVRASDGTWAGPNVVYRYGRLPKADGSLDPCALPQQDRALVEAMSSTTALACPSPSIVSGANGFWACVENASNSAKLKLNSTATNASGTPQIYTLESQFSIRGI